MAQDGKKKHFAGIFNTYFLSSEEKRKSELYTDEVGLDGWVNKILDFSCNLFTLSFI